jgi:hypothetical protein
MMMMMMMMMIIGISVKTIIGEYIYPFMFSRIVYLRGLTDLYTVHYKPIAKVEIFLTSVWPPKQLKLYAPFI